MRRLCRVLPLLGAASGWAQVPSALPLPTAAAVERIDVIGTAPLPGLGVDRELLPYGTLVLRRESIDRGQAGTLAEHLSRRVGAVQVADIQGSPYQGDFSFRGHRASGLLGAAQGLSVYLDGVRINEPFGDVVNWDTVPEYALRSVTLVPGANPAFGLNTLGGAVVLDSADGRTRGGQRAEIGFGSFGRKRLDLSSGGASTAASGWHHLVTATVFDERGWRDHSPGRIHQLFGKIGGSSGDTSWALTLLGARNTITGNGLVPDITIDDGARTPDLLAGRYRAVFTHPDPTHNRLAHASLRLDHTLDAHHRLQALAYARSSSRRTVNGDLVEEANADPDENASLNTTRTRQRAAGVALALAGHDGAHRWQVGLQLDRQRVFYRQEEQEGSFDASRGVIAGDESPELSAEVSGQAQHLGLYATDTWVMSPGTAATATLRWNSSRVSNRLTTVDDDSDRLEVKPEERFRYHAFNPAIGVVQTLAPALAVTLNLARNLRVPTVIELGCADPDEPCRLPAGLQSDPYLKPVTSRALEAGLRWGRDSGTRFELTLYRHDNRNDILFSSISATGQRGYFRNFDRTRHQGLDLSAGGSAGPGGALQWQLVYSRLDATYEAEGLLRIGERNVAVRPGMRIAGLAKHGFKAGVDWAATPSLGFGADLQAWSRRVTQGNEDGRSEDDEETRRDLALPGGALVHLRASWRPAAGVELFARVHNALDRRGASYAALAETPFDAQGRYTGDGRDARFVAPIAPRSWFVGVRLRY